MRIAGIAGKKHKQLKRGDAIELTPEAKVEAMAEEALVDSSPEGFMRIPVSSKIVGDATVISGTPQANGEIEPSQYIGTALIRYRTTRLATDKVFPVKEQKVKVHFKDAKDDIGAPDLKMMESTLL